MARERDFQRRAPRPGALEQLLNLPFFLLIFGVFSVLMLFPALFAGYARELETGRVFLYTALLGIIIFGIVAITFAGRTPRHGALGGLLSLFSTFVILPVFLAVPFYESLRTTSFLNAYMEMTSAITTTGATLFTDPARLNDPLHLWRAQVGWFGGMLMWIAASAILAPLNLGGFEVTAKAAPGHSDFHPYLGKKAAPRARMFRVIRALVPIYISLTGLLCILLIISGDDPLVALCHAMSIMATSGISPVGGAAQGGAGFTGELLMFLFMLFALSRMTFSGDTSTAAKGGLLQDPEFRLGLVIVFVVPVILFARHWLGAIDVASDEGLTQTFRSFWGALFTVLSFLSTTGFASADWGQAQNWSGLSTPGMILMGLALMGGGVATTAGGVKLLRVFALYLNGLREMERLVHPSSVSSARSESRRLQRNGAYIAWIFFMLFALTLAGLTILLALSGVEFEEALVLSVAGLTTTGPLTTMATEAPIRLAELSVAAKAIFCAAMVLGRLETLAIIALLTPDLWRG